MSRVNVTLGPVSAVSARAWLASARETLATARARPDLEVPADVLDGFDAYVAEWSAIAATTDPFVWSGEVDAGTVRHLASHWARLATIARTDPEGSGIRPASAEGQEFFDALAVVLVEAAAVDDRENLSERLEEVIPAFGETVAADPVSRARRVLLVDDNEDIRLLMRLALDRDPRFAVCGEAENGQEAVAFCERECPDVVLLDLLMPVMSGFIALPLIKAHCPSTDVVVFSAAGSPETTGKVTSLGASAFVQKTADTASVLDALAGTRS